jgi:hypothetical protein
MFYTERVEVITFFREKRKKSTLLIITILSEKVMPDLTHNTVSS